MYSNDAAFFEKTEYNGTIIEQFAGNKPNAVAAWQFLLDMAARGYGKYRALSGGQLFVRRVLPGRAGYDVHLGRPRRRQDTMGLDYEYYIFLKALRRTIIPRQL